VAFTDLHEGVLSIFAERSATAYGAGERAAWADSVRVTADTPRIGTGLGRSEALRRRNAAVALENRALTRTQIAVLFGVSERHLLRWEYLGLLRGRTAPGLGPKGVTLFSLEAAEAARRAYAEYRARDAVRRREKARERGRRGVPVGRWSSVDVARAVGLSPHRVRRLTAEGHLPGAECDASTGRWSFPVGVRLEPKPAPGLSLREVAERFGVSPKTVQSWVDRGRLKPIGRAKRGAASYFAPDAVEAIEGR